MRNFRYNLMICPEQQELILKLLEKCNYNSYDSLPNELKSIIKEPQFRYLVKELSNNCNISERSKNKKLFVLVDYTIAFTSGSLGSEDARRIDKNIYNHAKSALENPNTRLLVLIDEHNEMSYPSSREGRYIPIHGHTDKEKLIYGDTGSLFDSYYNSINKVYEDDGNNKVTFIYKDSFGSITMDNDLNSEVYDSINLIDGIMSHKFMNDSNLEKSMEPLSDLGDRDYSWNCLYNILDNLYTGLWEPDEIEIAGVATNVCVLSNAIILMSHYKNAEINIYEDTVASYDKVLHYEALDIMKGLGIKIK